MNETVGGCVKIQISGWNWKDNFPLGQWTGNPCGMRAAACFPGQSSRQLPQIRL